MKAMKYAVQVNQTISSAKLYRNGIVYKILFVKANVHLTKEKMTLYANSNRKQAVA